MPETRVASSFRDPSGFVFLERADLLRQINPVYLAEYRRLMDSGLYAELTAAGLLVPHDELDAAPWAHQGAAAVIRPERLSFISYPYEWCFSQLKDAALATLEIQRRALAHGMGLKDASAYNIQFSRGRPILLDTLSFETYAEGAPWVAYRQFCEHFLAPLVLMSTVDIRLGRLQREYLDGIPLDLAAELAPGKTKFSPGLAIHLHAHAGAQVKEMRAARTERPTRPPKGAVPKNALLGMLDSLKGAVERLDWKPEGTVWADYYDATNYSEAAFARKKAAVGEMLDRIAPRPTQVWDLGANTGEFSVLSADRGISCIAWDVDPGAVERSYRQHRERPIILPLLQDLTNPSPGIGWANHERDSLAARGPADALMALALVHHLAIGNNVSLTEVARYFAKLAEWLIVEFVPKSDSQVQRLLATRKDIYDGYTQAGFEAAFSEKFKMIERKSIEGSERTLYLYRRSAG